MRWLVRMRGLLTCNDEAFHESGLSYQTHLCHFPLFKIKEGYRVRLPPSCQHEQTICFNLGRPASDSAFGEASH